MPSTAQLMRRAIPLFVTTTLCGGSAAFAIRAISSLKALQSSSVKTLKALRWNNSPNKTRDGAPARVEYHIFDVEVITASGIEQGNPLREKLPIPRSVQARAAVASVGIHVRAVKQ
jgi:hypothetical protein